MSVGSEAVNTFYAVCVFVHISLTAYIVPCLPGLNKVTHQNLASIRFMVVVLSYMLIFVICSVCVLVFCAFDCNDSWIVF